MEPSFMSLTMSPLLLLGGRLSVDFVNAAPQNTDLSWEHLIHFLQSTSIVSPERGVQLLILPQSDPQAAVAWSGAEIIAEGTRARLRLCANPHCGLFFYDNSRTRRRRWCSMAACGNRSKVAAFARKHASARSTP